MDQRAAVCCETGQMDRFLEEDELMARFIVHFYLIVPPWELFPGAARVPHSRPGPSALVQYLHPDSHLNAATQHNASLCMPISQQTPRWKLRYQTEHEAAVASSGRGYVLSVVFQ